VIIDTSAVLAILLATEASLCLGPGGVVDVGAQVDLDPEALNTWGYRSASEE